MVARASQVKDWTSLTGDGRAVLIELTATSWSTSVVDSCTRPGHDSLSTPRRRASAYTRRRLTAAGVSNSSRRRCWAGGDSAVAAAAAAAKVSGDVVVGRGANCTAYACHQTPSPHFTSPRHLNY